MIVEVFGMAIELSREAECYLNEAVRNGDYPSVERALEEAIELLKTRDRLNDDLAAGIRQADNGELIPAEEVFARLHERALSIELSAELDRRIARHAEHPEEASPWREVLDRIQRKR
jgi:predicted transcriptional regulator